MVEFRVQKIMFLVLILGLVACSPDKPSKREDQWRFAAPEIVMPDAGDGSVHGRMKVGEASQKALPLNAELTFSKMTDDVILEIDSTCSREGHHFAESFKLSAPDKLEFGSIVPASILLDSNETAIECSFDFSAVNAHRSRHHFLIPGVKLVGGAEYGKLIVSKKLQRISPASSADQKVVIEVNDLDEIAVDSEITRGVAELSCADFVSRKTFDSVDTINWKQLAYKQPIEVLQNVLRKFRQPCRLALKDNRGVRVEISAPFVLRYPPPALEVVTSASLYEQQSTSYATQMPILNIKISNTANIDQYLSLPLQTVDMKQVWTGAVFGTSPDPNYYYCRALDPTASINYQITGTAKVVTANSRMIFLIQAKSEVSITVMANGIFRDLSSNGLKHAGYLFFFSRPARIERLEFSGDIDKLTDVSNAIITSEIPIFNTLPQHFAETQVFIPTTKFKADWTYVSKNLTEKVKPTGGD